MKRLSFLLLFFPVTLIAQPKTQLFLGMHLRPAYIKVSKSPGFYHGPSSPIVDFQSQVTNLSLKSAIERKNVKWGITIGFEYIIRYDHICYNRTVPDTNISYNTVGESIDGFIKDYIFYAKKTFSARNINPHIKLSYGFMNRGTKFTFTTYGGTIVPGLHVFYTETKNYAYNSFSLGFGFETNSLIYELDLYLVTRSEHKYNRNEFDFILPAFSIQYNLNLNERFKNKTQKKI